MIQNKPLTKSSDILGAFDATLPRDLKTTDVHFLLIGSPFVIGDSFAPLLGDALKNLRYRNLNGTSNDPVQWRNLPDVVSVLPRDKILIAIDAALGSTPSYGYFRVYRGGLRPGCGVGKSYPPIGDYSILGIVAPDEYDDLRNQSGLCSVPSTLVHSMVNELTYAIMKRFPLS